MKYKIGDKVKIRSWESMKKEFGTDSRGDIILPNIYFTRGMKEYCGKEVTIEKCFYDEVKEERYYIVDGRPWTFSNEMFEPVSQTIIIYRKDNKVIALDKQTKKEGVAICAPEDEFDFYVGAEIALGRLSGKVPPLKKPEPKYYNGEIVCIDAFHPFTEGKVYKVREGKFYDDNGIIHGTPYPYISLKDLNDNHLSKFIELIR